MSPHGGGLSAAVSQCLRMGEHLVKRLGMQASAWQSCKATEAA